MGNILTNSPANLALRLGNGGTSALLAVLLLAGSDLAQREWEKELMTWLAGHDQAIRGLGVVGFDVYEIAWTHEGIEQQRSFFLEAIDLALRHHRWEALGYDAPHAREYLASLRKLIEAVAHESIRPHATWRSQDRPAVLTKCPQHQVYMHAWGCMLCNDGPWEKPNAQR